jgi:hypothetical protein
MIDLKWTQTEEWNDGICKRWEATYKYQVFQIVKSLSGYSVFWTNKKENAYIYCLSEMEDAKRFVNYLIEAEVDI